MSSCTLIPLARPTFDVAAAQKFFDAARSLLTEVGATINGPTSLVMTPEDTASAEANLNSDENLYILFNASFADASAAVSLLSQVKGDVLLWSVREFGEVGDRLLLNSMCGSNLAAHALRVNGKRITHLHGNPDEPHVKDALVSALSGTMPSVGQPDVVTGELADAEKVKSALAKIQGHTIGAIGDAPAGFTPCTYDADTLKRLFGLNVINKTIPEIFYNIGYFIGKKVIVNLKNLNKVLKKNRIMELTSKTTGDTYINKELLELSTIGIIKMSKNSIGKVNFKHAYEDVYFDELMSFMLHQYSLTMYNYINKNLLNPELYNNYNVVSDDIKSMFYHKKVFNNIQSIHKTIELLNSIFSLI